MRRRVAMVLTCALVSGGLLGCGEDRAKTKPPPTPTANEKDQQKKKAPKPVGWRSWTAPNGALSVHFPGKPTLSESTGKTIFGETRVEVASVGDLTKGFYILQIAHVPASMTTTVDDLLETFAKSFVQSWRGGKEPKDLQLVKTRVLGLDAVAFTTNFVLAKAEVEVWVTARLLRRDQMVIALVVLKPLGPKPPRMMPTRFLESLRFRTPHPTDAPSTPP